MSNLKFPKALQPYQEILEETNQPFIEIHAKKGETTLFQSKFAGVPYFPKNMAYPVNKKGVPMTLLAQINFNEIPPLEPFPTGGILQFFVDTSDSFIGWDPQRSLEQKGYRVIYHEQIVEDESKLRNDFSFLENLDEEDSPIPHECALAFQLKEEMLGHADFQFDRILSQKIDFEQEVVVEDGSTWDLMDVFYDTISNSGHKIGGYAYFTQQDPRDCKTLEDHKVLLLQVDTDDDNDIMWGDAGVGNFFITKEDLEKRDFSNVYYTWDCC